MVTKMSLYNNRKDIQHYEISVFDKDWMPVKFLVTEGNIVQVYYQQRKKVDVYIRKKDQLRAVYVCSQSKSRVDGRGVTFVSTRICSKIK